MSEDETLVVAVPRQPGGRQQQLYALQPGDPEQIGGFRCIYRLKPTTDPVNADKPTPLLAQIPALLAGGSPDFVVLKVLSGIPTPAGRIRLLEERTWSQDRNVHRGSSLETDPSWVARDFCQGVSLDQLLGQPELTAERAVTLARVILTEIDEVHRHNEIHCDVKPANIIVNGREATLIDFESSRDRLGGSGRLVEATKPYASPEQLGGGGPARPILAATDLFSWGLTVSRMFQPNRHPFCVGEFDEDAVRRLDDARDQAGGPPQPDLAAIPDPQLAEAVLRALAWNPTDRPSAADLLKALGETGRNTSILIGATQVLQPPLLLQRPAPPTLLRRLLTADGILGEPKVGFVAQVSYAAAGVTIALVLALLLYVLYGVLVA